MPISPHPKLVRELALMAVPLLIIGGAALWITKRQQEQRAQESGPYRTVLRQVETLPVSPVEAWRGFDRKVRLHLGTEGRPPQGPGFQLSRTCWLGPSKKVFLHGNRGSQPLKIPISSISEGGHMDNNKGPLVAYYSTGTAQDTSICLLMNTSSFPHGEVRLDGSLAVGRNVFALSSPVPLPKGFSRSSGGNYQALARPLSLSIVVRHADEPIAPNIVRRGLPVRTLQGRLCSPHMQHLKEKGGFMANGYGERGDFIFSLQVPHQTPANEVVEETRFWKVEMRDRDGHLVKKMDHTDWHSIGYERSLTEKATIQPVEVRWRDVPAARGPLWVKGLVSINGMWPSPFLVQVRRAEDATLPSHLRLESIRFLSQDRIQVALRYLGNKTLETFNYAYHSPYDIRDQIGFVFASRREAGTDRLLSHWSEHLVYSDGQEDWIGAKATKVDKGAGGYIFVTYSIKPSRAGKNAVFKADVGLEDEGFIPVQIALPFAFTAKTVKRPQASSVQVQPAQ